MSDTKSTMPRGGHLARAQDRVKPSTLPEAGTRSYGVLKGTRAGAAADDASVHGNPVPTPPTRLSVAYGIVLGRAGESFRVPKTVGRDTPLFDKALAEFSKSDVVAKRLKEVKSK